MNIAVSPGDAFSQDTPLLALALWEGQSLPAPVADLLEADDWSPKPRQTALVYARGALPARRVLLVGLGKRGDDPAERLREAGGLTAQRARELKVDRYAFALPDGDTLSQASAAEALAEGSLLGSYTFLEYKTNTNDNRHTVSELTVVAGNAVDDVQRGVVVGTALARGVALARDLANRPGNDLPPSRLADAAAAVGARFGMGITVFGPDELHAHGFGGILGVGQGSANAPRFAVLEHGTKREGVPTVCLVGKGITFDSGGISIKPAENMDQMKMDMGGAAAVIGTMQVVGELNLPLHVVGLIGAAENMPSSTSYRPGDILKTLSGKTIEVLNTDAEGRIVLADVLFYAQRYQPDAIIDLATLTGAVMVALGPHAIGLMSNNDSLAGRVTSAGEAAGERAWRLPLWQPYKEMVKSDIADVKNSTGRFGGAITAAAFLANFVGDYPWAHLDIAGTAWTDCPRPYASKGATGVGVRLLTHLLRTWSS
jgi:leucyl aminopeptidase